MDLAKHEDEAVDSSTKASEFENNNSWFGIKMPESIFWSIPQLILFALVVGLEFCIDIVHVHANFCLANADGKMMLKCTHSYYYQCQI